MESDNKKKLPFPTKEETDAAKLAMLHKGPCSTPRKAAGDNGPLMCTCPRNCILHGRCCDCIAHHKQERLDFIARGLPIQENSSWMPHCLVYFDARNGIGQQKDETAGTMIPGSPDWKPGMPIH